jgi:hypothetical protein
MKQFFTIIIIFFTTNALAQNVGIGNTIPLMRLHVTKADSAVALFENTQNLSTDVSNALYFKTGNGSFPYTGAIKTIGQGTSTARLGLFSFASISANGLRERLSISDNGNIGIGTINPADPLTISTPVNSYGFTHTDGAVKLGSYITSGGGFFGTGSSHNLYLMTNFSTKMAILQNGNVGIGTNTPADPLSVSTPVNSYGFTHTDGTVKLGSYITSGGGFLGTGTNHNLYFMTNFLTKMAVLQNGNIGIGTTTPNYLLDVNGRGRLRHNGASAGMWYNKADNTEAAFVGMYNDTTFGFYGGNGWSSGFDLKNNLLGVGVLNPTAPLSFPNNIGNKIALWGDATGGHYGLGIQGALLQMYSSGSNADIAFGHGSSNAFTENMRIKGNGNIGVGVNNPTSKMEITELTNTNSRALYVGINNTYSSNEALRAESVSGTTGTAILAYRNGNGNAILATTLAGVGVNAGSGNASQDVAVKGSATTGVWGTATGNGGVGVRASNGGIASATGLWAQGYSFISGNFDVIGTLTKSAGTFKIDHPQDPENKFLIHSFVESPDMMNVYNGNISSDNNGFATITLPSYFEALNIDFKYQLTIVGKEFAQALVYEKIKNNQFIIRTDKPNIEVSWQVTGVRNDKYAQQNRIVPEVEKSAKQKGKYLNAKEFGVSDEKQITPKDR